MKLFARRLGRLSRFARSRDFLRHVQRQTYGDRSSSCPRGNYPHALSQWPHLHQRFFLALGRSNPGTRRTDSCRWR